MKTVVTFLAGIVLLTGCANMNVVHVTSTPPGARVYDARGVSECGSCFRGFRPYDNVQGSYKGITPLSYGAGMYAYDNVRVVWPDGEDSGWEQRPTGFFRDCTFSFVKRNTVSLAVVPAGGQSHSGTGVQPLPDHDKIPDRLKKLKELKDSGEITESEYESQRKVLVEKL